MRRVDGLNLPHLGICGAQPAEFRVFLDAVKELGAKVGGTDLAGEGNFRSGAIPGARFAIPAK